MIAQSPSKSAWTRGLVSGLVLSALCAAAFVRGASGDLRPALDPAILFPAGTPLVLSIDGGPCVSSAKDLAVARIWNEPEVQDFLKDSVDLAREQFDNAVKGVAEGLGLTVDDLMNVARGRLTVGVTRFELPESGHGDPSLDLMLAFEIRGAQKAIDALVKLVEAQAGAGGEVAAKDVTVGGVPARSIPVPPGGPFDSVIYLVHDGWLLAGTSTSQLEGALTRARSGDTAGSLAANGFYAASMKEVARPKTLASFFFDFGFLADLLNAMDEDGMKEMMAATGLESLKSVAMGIELDGANIRERTFVQMTPNSVMSRLQAPMDTGALLGRIPKRSVAAYAASLNLKEYFAYFVTMMRNMPEAGHDVDEALTAVEHVLGPTWREDLLPNLGPEFAAFVALPQYGVVPDIGVLIKVGNREKVEGVITNILERPKMKAAHRMVTLGDQTIHYMDLGVLGIDRDFNLRPAYAFVGDYLLVTPAPHSAKSIIHSMSQTGGGLLAREDFASAFGRLKSESPDAGNLGVAYVDTRWLAGFLLDSAFPIIQSAVPPDALEVAAPLRVDLGKLPSTQAIVRHLSAIVTQNQTKAGGTYSETVSPTGMIGALGVIGAGVGWVTAVRMPSEIEIMEPPIEVPPEPGDDKDR